MKNVLITNMYAGIGGGEIAILEHASFLKARGFKVHVVLLEHGDFEKRLNNIGVDIVEVFPFSWGRGKVRALMDIFSVTRKLLKFIQRYKIELVISYTLNDMIFSGFASNLARVPQIYRSQADVIGVDKDVNATWMGKLFFPVLKFISPYVVATTKGEVKRMRQLGYDEKKLSTVYLGVDVQRFLLSREKTTFLKKALGVADGQLIVSIFGRLTEWKGQLEYIRALAELVKLGHSVKGWIVGGDSFGGGSAYSGILLQEIHDLELTGTVQLLGMRDDVAELMNASDIVVHASYKEPFGLVIVEAMMCGKPVVASNVSGPQESVCDGVTGVLVEPRDVGSLVKHLSEMLNDDCLRDSMGKAALLRSKELFDKNKNLGELTDRCVKLVRG